MLTCLVAAAFSVERRRFHMESNLTSREKPRQSLGSCHEEEWVYVDLLDGKFVPLFLIHQTKNFFFPLDYLVYTINVHGNIFLNDKFIRVY